jgi:hypothetical protein
MPNFYFAFLKIVYSPNRKCVTELTDSFGLIALYVGSVQAAYAAVHTTRNVQC